ncbi:MAG: DUF6232 family protein [Planktothrix sp.]
MAPDNFFKNSADEIIKGINTITITRKTVRFGSDVYQMKNITGFGMIVIKTLPIPWIIVIGFALISFIVFTVGSLVDYPQGFWLGAGLLLMTVFMIWVNQESNRTYGLKLYLPSSGNKIFLSNDGTGIQKIVSVLYEFMETENQDNSVVTIAIDQSQAKIGVGSDENVNPR